MVGVVPDYHVAGLDTVPDNRVFQRLRTALAFLEPVRARGPRLFPTRDSEVLAWATFMPSILSLSPMAPIAGK
jgi:hypothetical protein